MNKGIIFIIIAAITMSACGNQKPTVELISNADLLLSDEARPYAYHQSKIIGINPMIPVKADGSNLDPSLRKVIDAFGVLTFDGDGGCSVTHIGQNHVLTAGHCVLERAGKKSHASCDHLGVSWGYRGTNPVVTMKSKCMEIVYAQLSNKVDFAILKVDQAPKAAIPVAVESRPTAPDTKITIFGYPQIRPLEWSQYCSVHVSSDAGRNFKRSMFVHQCDTEPGNSGSSILAVTSSGLTVMGVHNGAAPMGIDFNYATYMYEARKLLKRKGVNIDQLTRK